jgi:hypothetical protein
VTEINVQFYYPSGNAHTKQYFFLLDKTILGKLFEKKELFDFGLCYK